MAVYLNIKQIKEIQNAILLSIITLKNAKILSSDKIPKYRKKVESKIYVQDLAWFLQNTDIKSLKSPLSTILSSFDNSKTSLLIFFLSLL